MDAMERIRLLRRSISGAIERLFHMEQALEKAEQEALSLKAQISYLERTMDTLRRPGVAVLLREFFLMRTQILDLKAKQDIILREIKSVEAAQAQLEAVLIAEEAELEQVEASLGPRVVPFRRNE
jgi:uncharacterized protein Yka (UPF0111/DUF47 family)